MAPRGRLDIPPVVDHQRDVRFENGWRRVRPGVSPSLRQLRVVDAHEAADPGREGRISPTRSRNSSRTGAPSHRVLEDGDQFPSDQQVVQRNKGGAARVTAKSAAGRGRSSARGSRRGPPCRSPRTENGGVASDPVPQIPVGHFLLPRNEGHPGGWMRAVVFEDVLDEQGIPPVSAAGR